MPIANLAIVAPFLPPGGSARPHRPCVPATSRNAIQTALASMAATAPATTAVPAGDKIRIALDRGGTFLDAVASVPGRGDVVFKLLSHDPAHYADAPTEAIRRVLEIAHGRSIPRSERLDTAGIENIRLATTVATNALLERKGQRHALVTTRGFRDLLLIGNQSRPDIFDLSIRRPDVLYAHVIEADERVTLVGATNDPAHAQRSVRFRDGHVAKAYTGPDAPPLVNRGGEWVAPEIVQGVSGEAVAILVPLDETKLRADLRALRQDGVDAVAVTLLHAFTFPDHEDRVEKIAREEGFAYVSTSRLRPVIKAVARGHSVSADAYLTPVLHTYLDSFFRGFAPSLRDGTAGTRVEFMMSDGGLTHVARFSGLQSILSGPAGGVVGMALTSYDRTDGRAVIGFDMGGTSTDVSRFHGRYEHVFESTTAGVTIAAPQLDVNTVASGGSSMLSYRNGMFAVGPESASAHPGPAAYRKGGPLTITDANLVTGRLAVEMFPRIFGPNEDEGLDYERSLALFTELTARVNADRAAQGEAAFSVDEVAHGFIRVANETMSRPIRALTEAKGYAASRHVLASFGGAGGQHACSLARGLGIRTVVVHMYSSLLSAYGMALADRVHEVQVPASVALDEANLPALQARLAELQAQVERVLVDEGFASKQISYELYLNLRYDGTDTQLMTLKPSASWDVQKAFVDNYLQEVSSGSVRMRPVEDAGQRLTHTLMHRGGQFGFVLADKAVIVDDLRVKGVGHSYDALPAPIISDFRARGDAFVASAATGPCRPIYFEGHGRLPTPVLRLGDVRDGEKVDGPAVLVDETQTVLIEPLCSAYRLERGVLVDIRTE